MRGVACILMLLAFEIATAQETDLEVTPEFRSKFVYDSGYKKPIIKGFSNTAYISQRSRINLRYKSNPYEAYISIQDVRLWGDDDNYNLTGTYGNTQSLSIHQSWFKLDLSDRNSIKIGRQPFSYDDQRLLAQRNWNDYQVTYDAALFEYKKDDLKLDLGFSYNSANKNNRDYPQAKIKTLGFIHFEQKLNNFNFAAIALVTGKTASDTTEILNYIHSIGINCMYHQSSYFIRSSLYYQIAFNEGNQLHSAICFSMLADKKWHQKLNAGIGLDYLSGNSISNSTVDHRFDLLYGKRHGWYGSMDYFNSLPVQGLVDYYFKSEVNLIAQTKLEFDVHFFQLANSIPNIDISVYLGSEFDFKLSKKLYDLLNLEFGYSNYFQTSTFQYIKGLNNNSGIKFPQFVYTMVSYKLN